MARIYDVISKLENSNQKPKIKIDAEHEFTINNSKAAVITIMALNKDKDTDDIEMIDKIIKIALGEDAFNYIETLNLPYPAHMVIVNAIMAGIGDVSMEEIEEEIKKQSPR